MKVVILAGGMGTRIAEESDQRPKPMVHIGERPILWHIMKHYSTFGYKDFVILLGYKGYAIKEYFANFYLHNCDATIDVKNNSIEVHNNASEDWKVTLVETGLATQTGGRLLRARRYLSEGTFLLTYGDGVSDVNLTDLVTHHRASGNTVTVTAVQPEGRFGSLTFGEGDKVSRFNEKPWGDGSWINGGFFVCEPGVFDYLQSGDETMFEKEPLEHLARDQRLGAFRHSGFWKPLDTLRDKLLLNQLWASGTAPWKTW